MKKAMPIGIDDFGTLRAGYYFVDKTDFIRQLIDEHSAVTLLTRPRRFGKTLTMSMLDYFFSLQREQESRFLFDGLAVERAGQKYMQERGQYPVIFVSLKDLKDITWEKMLDTFRSWISNWFISCAYLEESPRVDEDLKARFTALKQRKADISEMQMFLAIWMEMLRQHHGKKVILLIDEYDAPIQQAWENGFYKECISFMKQMLGSVLKGNENLEFAVMTGVLRVAKESIFSDLNNLDVCSVLSTRYDDVIGFTPDEVKKMAEDLGMSDKLPEIKQWYDGYRFGQTEMYNPWSVINFFRNGEFGDYWVNTSANGILHVLLEHADAERIEALQNLLAGGTISVTLNERVIYEDIGRDKSALYTLLLTTGYLTAESASRTRRNRYALRIPNDEIRDVYATEILNHLAHGIDTDTFDDLFDYLFHGDHVRFARQLQKILTGMASTFDTANKESFYHGFMLGLTALLQGSGYAVESNRESGYGRFDLAIFPKDAQKAGVIMEFKAAANEDELQTKAEEALAQIEDRAYDTEFKKRGLTEVWKYGMAFCGKKIYVAVPKKSD
ncbi:AAA family ATPase [Mitsuokella sp. WILCCON 0060]|uniref:AAA family ATPase n=1 Tax=unclassified Mitsuokella TaxID=2637239 RepID=UPI003F0E9A2C